MSRVKAEIIINIALRCFFVQCRCLSRVCPYVSLSIPLWCPMRTIFAFNISFIVIVFVDNPCPSFPNLSPRVSTYILRRRFAPFGCIAPPVTGLILDLDHFPNAGLCAYPVLSLLSEGRTIVFSIIFNSAAPPLRWFFRAWF